MSDQRPVVDFLARLLAAEDGREPEHVLTHISHVLIGRSRVFKLKRAVALGYVDFSTPEKRLDACRRELDLNRRTAPALYREVLRLTGTPDGGIELGGTGPLLDGAVAMGAFDQADLFDRMALEGRLEPAHLESLARHVAAFHRGCAVSKRSGAALMEGVLAINERAFASCGLMAPEATRRLAARFRAAFVAEALRLDARGRAGRVRHGHGDLHLRNVCLLDGEPTLFDCLEFDDDLATVDVLYDIAFLLMDLRHRGLDGFANLAMNRYLDESGDGADTGLVPFLMAVRAAVRAHVGGAQAAGLSGAEAEAARREALAYVTLAEDLLEQRPPRLIAIGGFSGTGKSTTAALLAPRIGGGAGARVLNSDRIRKSLHGVAAEHRLGAEAYRPEISAAVYERMLREAGEALAGGACVVVDAVFDRPADRDAIAAVAKKAGAPFAGFWLTAAPDVLTARVAARRGGPSDATVDVLAAQLARDPGPMAWTAIDSSAGAAATADRIAAALT